jgi:hypothetical protein
MVVMAVKVLSNGILTLQQASSFTKLHKSACLSTQQTITLSLLKLATRKNQIKSGSFNICTKTKFNHFNKIKDELKFKKNWSFI